MVLKFFGGSISFTGVRCPDFECCTRCEMVGNGRNAREVGNEGVCLDDDLWAGGTPCAESDRGEDTAGRDNARVMVTDCQEKGMKWSCDMVQQRAVLTREIKRKV